MEKIQKTISVISTLLASMLILTVIIAFSSDEAQAATNQSTSGKIVATNHKKYSYAEMKNDIKLLAEKYPDKVSYNVIGKSEDGRNIYDVVLGNPEAKKSMLVVAAIHAREYMTSLVCLNQIEYYLRNYSKKIDGKKVGKTLDAIAIHYIPMANPDGVTISQFGIKRIRDAKLRLKLRKIVKTSKCETKYWKANARGVDLNDNFPIKFKKKGKPNSEGYTGPRACSESESKAISGLVKDLKATSKLKGYVNYHAMGSILFGACSASKQCKRVTTKMFKVAKKATGYKSAAGIYHAVTSGSFRAYVMHKLDVPSITLEVGKKRCPGPISEFPSIWKKNKNVVLRVARIFA